MADADGNDNYRAIADLYDHVELYRDRGDIGSTSRPGCSGSVSPSCREKHQRCAVGWSWSRAT
jgi:hypothetical protein